MKLGILHQLLRLTKIKTVSDTTDSFLGQKWPIFAPKTAFFADFAKKWGHFYTFWYLKWIKNWHTSSILKADAGNTVQTLPTLFGAKNDPFLPPPQKKEMGFGWFWDNWRYFHSVLISKMDGTQHTRSTFMAQEDKTSFGHSWLILGPKMAHFYPPKAAFLAFGIIEGISILF